MKMSKKAKKCDEVKENVVQLLQENNGSYGTGELWQEYNRKFKQNVAKKALGLQKMSDLFNLYPNDFEMVGDFVFLKHFQKKDKYGMPLPSPIKPLWGAAAKSNSTNHKAEAPSKSKLLREHVHSTPQNRTVAPSTSTSDLVSISSSSDSDSDSDCDLKIIGQDPPKGRLNEMQDSSGFLPLTFSSSSQQSSANPQTPPQQSLNQEQQLLQLQHMQQRGAASLADIAGGRGRSLELMFQQQRQSQIQPGMQFPAAFSNRDMHPVPGIMANHVQQQIQQSRSRQSSESDSHNFHPPDVVDRPSAPPKPPSEPTWPPVNSKLGVPPGVPRERKQVTVKPVHFQRGQLSKEQVEAVAEDCIEMLAEAGDFVSPDRIMRLLLQRYNVRDLRDLQVPGIRFPYNINFINEHERLLAKVNASIEAFVLSRSICTLYDLEQTLLEFSMENKSSFEALRLGPLQCLPIVYEKFKFPQNEKIPDITTADVLDVLSQYLTKHQKWVARLDMEEVMAYFVDYYHVQTAYSLGIRIRSLPLAAQVLKKSHRDAANTRKSVVNRCMATVQEEVYAAFQKVKANIFQTAHTDAGENVELRRHYCGMHAEAVMIELLEKFLLLMSIDTPTTRNERKRHTGIEQAVNVFLTTVRSEPLARALLHLAVCVGRLDLQEAAMELLAPAKEKNDENSESSKEDQSKARQPPSKAILMDKVKRYVERCLAQGTLTLSHLDRIEEKLLEDFGFPTFVAMGFGRFIYFLLHDPAPKALLEECGGLSLGGSHHSGQRHTSMTEVLEFMRQCKGAALTQETDVEKVLCHQFHVTEARLLGYGSMHHLVEAAEKPGKHHVKDYRILYEMAFCGRTSEPVRGKREVGMLGHQSREAALACLQNCPLLEDMEKWSHWSLVFEPQHGSLKDFLQKYGGVHTIHMDGGQKTITTDIIALETEPGCLLRLVSTTSPSEFEAASARGDVRATCGHLASLVMSNRGVEHTPMALLANHTRSALFVLHTATSDVPGGPGQPTVFSDPAIQFVLNCLILLPLRLCVAVANQVFLEPLAQVVGSSRSKSLLLEACSLQERGNESGKILQMKLAQLGCMLGIQDWTRPLTDTFTFPSECITVARPLHPAPRDELLGDDEEEPDEEEESEEESEEEEEASSSSFLSDEEVEETEIVSEEESDTGDNHLAVANKEDAELSGEGVQNSKEEEEEEEVKGEVDEKMEDVNEDSEKGELQRKETADNETEVEDKEAISASDSDAREETEEERCRRIIEQIQRDEFGVGVELNEDGQRLMKVQQERLGRSLDRLSRDLYSKDTHFVLELVQNADDNSYPNELITSLATSSVCEECPSVKFIIGKTGVIVLNNECGFREADVRALCDVGRSTKGKHKYGYIGQKGIGFKSVFRVTGRPEVHSNGFHLCFDVDSGPMGYILPHWCEDTEPFDGWMTKIVLPLKEDLVSEARSLAARFNDIHPSLLLFLHRLRSIHVDNKVEGTELSMRRVDLGENIVEIHHNQGATDRWLVIKKQLDASSISLQAKSGVEVESTEIALAFPLRAKWQSHHVQVAPAKQPVFAFLPLRSYGFRFIVQGDFDVPSSREDVDRDSSWNQWLRNEIHTLFIEAFDVFRTHPEFEGLQSLWSYLQFVPLEDEILDFFKPVATQILQKLRATPCMPTVSALAGKKGNIQWKLPSQTVIVQDSLMHEVISPELLEHHLGLYYVHRDAVAMLNPLLTRSLGVESVTTEHLIQIGRSLVTVWEQALGEEEVVQIAKWLACVYRSMDDFQENSTLINTLRSMKVIPLSTGQLVALNEVTVFMLSDSGSSTEKIPVGKKDPLNVLRQDLQLLHGRLVTTEDNEVNSQVCKLLSKLDIKQLTAQDIVHHHILPVLRSKQWQDKSHEVLVSYLIYIKEQRSKNNSLINMEELKAVARVLTNHGVKNPATDNVHFSPAYGMQLDLKKQLPGYDWTLLHEQYMQYQVSRVDIHSWQEFFTQLGVAKLLIVRQKEVKIKREELDSSPWAPLKEMWPQHEDAFIIQDHVCEEFQELIVNNKAPHALQEQMKMLFSLLDLAWDTQYVVHTKTKLQSGMNGSVLKDEIPSSFAIALQTMPWVPSIESDVIAAGEVYKIEEKETLLPPSALYIPDPKIKQLLAHTVCYLAVQSSRASSFLQFLHIKSVVETSAVRNALLDWGKRDDKKSTEPAIFCSSLAHLKQVYLYLYDNLIPKDYQDLFHHHTVIWVPKTERIETSHQRAAGRMLGRNEVWWQDSSQLFHKYRASLLELHSPLASRHPVEHLYRDIWEAFKAARLQQGPSQADFAELLTVIASACHLKEEGVLPNVLSIYAMIGHYISMPVQPDDTEWLIQTEQKQKVTEILKTKKFMASKKQVWVSPADKPMLADDPELEKMFSSKDGVHFLIVDLPKTPAQRISHNRFSRKDTSFVNVEDVLAFLSLFDVRQLSEEVQKQEIPEMFVPCASGQQYMHVIIPYIQRFLLSHYPDIQQTHHHNGMAARLKKLLFVKTKKLQVRYSLKSLPDVYEIRDEKCVIMDTHFYFHDKFVESRPEINKEVSNFFSDGNTDCMKDLRHFLLELHLALEKNNDHEVKTLLEKQEVQPLPEGFVPWEVPKPALPKPPPPPPPPPPKPASAEPVKAGDSEGNEKTGPGLRAWPPPAPGEHRDGSSASRKTGGESKPMGASIWPPPKGPEEVQRRRELPSNLHIAPHSPSASDSVHHGTSGARSSSSVQHPSTVVTPTGTGSVHPAAHTGAGHPPTDSGHPRSGQLGGNEFAMDDKTAMHGREKSAVGVDDADDGSGSVATRRQDSSTAGKRKSSDVDSQTSDSKRLAPDGKTYGEATVSGSEDGVQRQAEDGDVFMAPGERQASDQPRKPSSITRKGWPPYRPKPDQLQLPIWTQLACETEYEELGRGGDLKIPSTITLSEASNRTEIGRWGELLVYDYLLQQKEMHEDIYDVIWMNDVEESGKPYDFEVVCTPGDEAYSVYIEVKATKSSKKEVFEISSKEMKFAFEQGERYHIYRIFNAGVTGQVQLVRLANVSYKMDIKEVGLLMII